jgi:hypothetical protein
MVFTRGATEAINLVAQTWGAANLKAGDRVLLSLLEHHSNIVPWQLLRERTGIAIDVCPLTEDGRIDLDAAEAMLTPSTSWWPLRMFPTCSARCSMASRGSPRAWAWARLLLDGCQAVPRLPVDVAALGCDFYVFSAHKLYGPTGIGALVGAAPSCWPCDAALAGRRGDDRPRDFRDAPPMPPRRSASRLARRRSSKPSRWARRSIMSRCQSASRRSTRTRRRWCGSCAASWAGAMT